MKTMTRAILSGGVLVLHSSLASANLTNQGILDQVVTDYATAEHTGHNKSES